MKLRGKVENFNKISLSFLQYQEKEKLFSWYNSFEPGAQIMPHELSNLSGVELSKVLLFIKTLSVKGMLKLHLMVYHICDYEVPIQLLKFGEGFPILPFYCSECSSEVNDDSELEYDYLIKK